MPDTFSDSDVEKTVETTTGDEIGVVTDAEGDTARVEPTAGVMDSIRSALGWGQNRAETIRVHEDDVVAVSDSFITIERSSSPEENPEAGIMTGTVPSGNRGGDETERPADDERTTERTDVDATGGSATGQVDHGETGQFGHEDDTSADPASTDEMSDASADPASADEPRNPGDARFEEETLESDPVTDTDPVAGSGPSGEAASRTGSGGERDDLDPERSDPTGDEPSGTGREPEEEIVEELNRGPPVDPTADIDERDAGASPDDGDGIDTGPADDVGTAPEQRETGDGGVSMETGDTTTQRDTDDGGGRDQGDSPDADGESRAKRTGDDDGVDLSDELDRGVDVQSVDDLGSGEASGDSNGATSDADGSAADEFDVGTDADRLEAAADVDAMVDESEGSGGEASDGRSSRSETDRTDPADELDPGIDPDSMADAVSGPDDEGPTGGRTADSGSRTSSDADIGPETIVGSRTGGAEGAVESTGTHPVEEVPSGDDVAEALDEDTGLPPEDTGRRGVALDVERLPEPTEESIARTGFDAQRRAITDGQRLLARGLEAQQTLFLGTLESQAAFQRRSLRGMRRLTRSYVDALTGSTGVETETSDESRSSPGTDTRDDERLRELETTLDRQTRMLSEIQDALESERDAERDRDEEPFMGSR